MNRRLNLARELLELVSIQTSCRCMCGVTAGQHSLNSFLQLTSVGTCLLQALTLFFLYQYQYVNKVSILEYEKESNRQTVLDGL